MKPDPIGASPIGIVEASGSSRSAVGGATARVSTSRGPAASEPTGSDSAIRRATSCTVAVESAVTTTSVASPV
jgi:hypothetical protein